MGSAERRDASGGQNGDDGRERAAEHRGTSRRGTHRRRRRASLHGGGSCRLVRPDAHGREVEVGVWLARAERDRDGGLVVGGAPDADGHALEHDAIQGDRIGRLLDCEGAKRRGEVNAHAGSARRRHGPTRPQLPGPLWPLKHFRPLPSAPVCASPHLTGARRTQTSSPGSRRRSGRTSPDRPPRLRRPRETACRRAREAGGGEEQT